MIIHKEFCPINLSVLGKWWSTVSPSCNCDNFTQTDISSEYLVINPEPTRDIFKIFRCRGCYTDIHVPISFRGRLECEHDKFSTGAIKDLIDIY